MLLCTSCMRLLGIKEPNAENSEQLARLQKAWQIQDVFYSINRTAFLQVYNQYPTNSDTFNQLIQPLQVIVFDNKQQRIAHLLNCHFPGSIKLKWNYQQHFDTLPISSIHNSLLHHTLTLDEISSILHPYVSTKELESLRQSYDYLYFIYLPSFMPRYSKDLLKMLNYHYDKFPTAKIKRFYVWTDNLFISGLDKTGGTK